MSLDCETMLSFLLFIFQFSVAITMPFPYRGSNSEETQPYGPYNHLNLQMPHIGSMYGFGLPHYSQMIQMQQALSRQPLPWMPPMPKNKESVPPQMPQPQIKQHFQQHPMNPLPQPKPNYQHVTNQPLQLPPAPAPQTPQMFPPFANPMNPFWPQGNYFGYFGFGGRPPYNSEEANEDEEAPKEKDPPKAEPPVTESSNTTVDNNATIVDQGPGNSTAQNESLVGEIPHTPNVLMSGSNISPPRSHMLPSIHGRHSSIIHGPARPSHHIIRIPNRENLHKNFQQRYYTVNRVLGGRGDHPNNNYPSNILINKVGSLPHHPTDKRVINGGTQTNQGVAGRPASPLANIVRGIFPENKPSISRTEPIQKPNGYNTGVRGDHPKPADHSQARENTNVQINRNIMPDHNIIIVQPQHDGHISEYSRYPIVEERRSKPSSGIFSNHYNEQYQPRQSETSQKSNIYDTKNTYINHNIPDIPLRNEDNYAPSGTFDTGGTWNNRYISVGTGKEGQPPEIIYLVSSLPSDNDATNDFSNQRQNQWEHISDHQAGPHYVIGQRGANINTEDELNPKTSTNPLSENQPWQTHDFSTAQTEHIKPQPYRQPVPSRNPQTPLSEQGKKELYMTIENRHPNNQKRYLLVSKPGLPKTQEQVQFSGNEPSYHLREPGLQKLTNTLDRTGYYTDYETNPHTLGKNSQATVSRTFDAMENVQIVTGDDMHLRQNSPVHLQILTIPETQPWGYNPQEIPFEQRQYNIYDSYPSNMRVQLPYQREMGRENGGQRYYMCTLPFMGDDPGRGIPNSLLYLCCKLSQADQGSPPGTVNNFPEYRLTLKEYNEYVPQQDRTHRQHTRNVGDPPKPANNQPSNTLLPNCSASNTPENTLTFGSQPGGTPCTTKACDGQNLEHHEGFKNFATVPCGTRGDNYLPPKQEPINPQKKNFIGRENPEIPLTNVQDDGSHRIDNNMRMNKGTGKLLQILTCPKDRQILEADTPASLDNRNKMDAFSMKDEFFNGQAGINNQDGSTVPQLAEGDPANNAPDCLILNK